MRFLRIYSYVLELLSELLLLRKSFLLFLVSDVFFASIFLGFYVCVKL